MEVAVPPGQSAPTFKGAGFNKELPDLPNPLTIRKRNSGRSAQSAEQLQGPNMSNTGAMNHNASNSNPGLLRTHSSPEGSRRLPHPPAPPMSKSSQKIMQLTGFNPRLDNTQSTHSYTKSPGSSGSSSSGSFYDEDIILEQNPLLEVPALPNAEYLTPSIYSASASSSSTVDTGKGLRSSDFPRNKDGRSKTKQSYSEVPEPDVEAAKLSTELTSLDDLIAQERERYESHVPRNRSSKYAQHTQSLTEAGLDSLVPPPLVLRPKKSRQSRFGEGSDDDSPSNIFATARDSMVWGLKELTEPKRNRSSTNAPMNSRPTFPPPTKSPKSPKSFKTKRKRNFSSGNHPLKSPFPFSPAHQTQYEIPEAEKQEDSLGKRLSGAFRIFSGGSKHAIQETVISNAARSPSGPDTPFFPRRPGFMGLGSTQKGIEHLHEVVDKAKKSFNKQERRREEIKRNIVVIGITDQSPGMSPLDDATR